MNYEMFDLYHLSGGNHTYGVDDICSPSYKKRVLDPFAELVLRQFGPGALVLDAASGRGEAADLFIEGGLRAMKMDLSAHALAMTTGLRVRADIQHLPCKPQTFHAIHIKDAIVHIWDKVALFNELAQVLVPRGLICIVTQINSHSLFTVRDGTDRPPEFFKDLKEYEEQFKFMKWLLPNAYLSPPYFRTTRASLWKDVDNTSFEKIDERTWTNEKGEPDWFADPIRRYVLTLQKKSGIIDQS